MADDENKKDSDIVASAVKKFEKFLELEQENRRRAEDAINFRALNQWPDEIKRDRENNAQPGGARPCPVLDKTNQFLRQIVNEERLNPPSIKVRPVDDKADVKVAEIYNGIIRHIQDSSDATTAYTTAGEHAADGGHGYWRILTEYTDPMSFEQDIRIVRVPNRFSVLLGPHTQPDGSDAKGGFIWEDMPLEEFKAKYPKAKTSGFEADEWGDEDTVRIAEYYCIKVEYKTIVLLDTGEVMAKPDYERQAKAAEAAGIEAPAIMAERETEMPSIKWYKITGSEIIERRDVVGSFIPIVEVIGNEIFMPDGKRRLSGAIESAMDSQRLHNYATANFIEHVALAPRAPWVGYTGQFATKSSDWLNANRRNIAVLEADMIEVNGQAAPLPQRTQPAGIPPGWQQLIMSTEHGVEASFGMYGANIGGPARERSGVALEGQKQQGSIGSYHYPDNLARSIRHTGRILIEMIPKIYDTQRVARILGEDGEPSSAYLNPEQETAVMEGLVNGRKQSSYNLNVGKYDVTVTVGPSWTTKRQEGAAMMTEAMRANPELTSVMGDLYFKSLDVPYADQISKRMKAVLNPAVAQAEAQGEQADPKSQAMMAQIDQGMQLIQQQTVQLQQAAQEVEAAKAEVQGEAEKLANERKLLAAEYEKRKAQLALQELQAINNIKETMQTAEPEQLEPQQPPVMGIDPALIDLMESVSRGMENLAQLISQNNELAARHGDTLANMIQSDAAYRQHVSGVADKLLNS